MEITVRLNLLVLRRNALKIWGINCVDLGTNRIELLDWSLNCNSDLNNLESHHFESYHFEMFDISFVNYAFYNAAYRVLNPEFRSENLPSTQEKRSG